MKKKSPQSSLKLKISVKRIEQAKGLSAILLVAGMLFFMIAPVGLFAQTPMLSYSGAQTYVAGTAITPLSPASSGVAALGSSNSVNTLGSGFSHPTAVAVDAAGNVYVADYSNNAIKKIPIGGGAP